MPTTPSPKSDQLRALREAKFSRKPAKAAPEKMAIAKAAVANVPSPKAPRKSNKQQSNTDGFDRTAYQRDYMRKRRAEAKA